MRLVARLGVFVALLLAPQFAEAVPIVVAEFRWDVDLLDPGVECEAADPGCEAVPAAYLSTYSLTGLWDDASAPPVLTGTVDLAGGVTFDWLPLAFDLGYFDQLAIAGQLPATAMTTLLFDFEGQIHSLAALLVAPGAATLTFDPDQAPAAVPEPGTLTLFGAGLAVLLRGAARRRNRPLA